jgi:hypothetical protein
MGALSSQVDIFRMDVGGRKSQWKATTLIEVGGGGLLYPRRLAPLAGGFTGA